jgi:hypothetical protein
MLQARIAAEQALQAGDMLLYVTRPACQSE